MLNQIISTMMKTFIITEIDILYLQTKMDLCKTKCENSSGHLPYLFEGMSLVQPQPFRTSLSQDKFETKSLNRFYNF